MTKTGLCWGKQEGSSIEGGQHEQKQSRGISVGIAERWVDKKQADWIRNVLRKHEGKDRFMG